MRFSLFVHMERLGPAASDRVLYEDFLTLCRMADEGGMRAIWTGEHHAMAFTIAPNPFLNLVDLARRTRNARLGTSSVIAPFWHPIRLAGEAAMADLLCDGRLEIGLARGAYVYEYDRLSPGLDAMTAGVRLREMVPALKALWAGDYAHDSDQWRFPTATAVPSVTQRPHPPLWIAARDPNSHAFAVAEGCGVQCTPLHQGVDEVETLKRRFDDACVAHPDRPRPPIMLLQHGYVASSEAEAQAAAEALSGFYHTFAAWFRADRPVRGGSIEPPDGPTKAAAPHYAPEALRRNCLIGEPAEVVERLARYAELGFDEFALWIDSGMDGPTKRRSLERFIERVMPAFEPS